MPTSPRTRSSTPRFSEQTKKLVVPSGIVSTGWPAVNKTCHTKLGITFDPWQEATGKIILAKRADGMLASMIDGVGMSLPRQVGKTYLVGAVMFALCINTPGLLVIWSAHHARTHGETFLAMQAFAQRARVAPYIKATYTGSGDEEVRFHNGSRILFGARERGFGRGIPGVDILVFDEGQILSDKALSNMLATLNTSYFGLQLYMGTPPKPDDMFESFKRMRDSAFAGTLTDGAWIEFGADAGANPNDRAQWRKANPSFPGRTPVQSMLRLQRKLTAADWLREGLGIWDDDSTKSAISPASWAELKGAVPDGIRSYGVKFSPDGARVSLAVAVRPADGPVFVEVIDSKSMASGLAWLADWLAERWRGAASIVIDGKAHTGALVNELRARGVPAKVISTPTLDQVVTAHSMIIDAVTEKTISHAGQPGLDTAVRIATWRKIGNRGGFGFEPMTVDGDVTPLESVTLGHWGAKTSKRRPGRRVTGMVMT